MPFTLTWYNKDEGIIKINMDGKVTWDEYHNVISQVVVTAASVSYRVDVILAGTQDMPQGNPLTHFRTAMQKFQKQSNIGMMVVYTNIQRSGFMQIIGELAARAAGINLKQKARMVATFDEALQLIAREREKVVSASKPV
jgi:hypothetical protein